MKIANQYLETKIFVENFTSKDGKYFAFSKISPFYPDGKGGQLGDRGLIDGANVLSVKEDNGWIVHELDKPIEVGEYDTLINQERRLDIAQQHTGQHILSAAFVHVAEIQTVSFRMGDEYSTIDLDVPYIEPQVIKEVEYLSNKITQTNLSIQEINTSVEEANKQPLRKKLSEKIKDTVRLIKIGDFDTAACSGFHTDFTGEVGMIKIIGYEKVKGNLTRIYAVSGMRALKYFQKYNDVLKEISKNLTSSVEELPLRIEKLQNQAREQALTLSKLSEEYAKLLSTNLPKEGLIYLEGYSEIGNSLWKILDLEKSILVFYDGAKYTIASKRYNVKEFIKVLTERFGGKGGGKEELGTYQSPRKINRTEFDSILKDMG
ncbi:MAG: alanyl-tRNA editing protein [Fervidobacterium sp.]|nr:alanyl-tRNA editing protein [Fervidobacterium sp.]